MVKRYGGPEVLEVIEDEMAEPGPSQVLVRLKAAGVNPVDTYQRSGTRGYLPELPYTPGLDGAGIVTAAGSEVDGVLPGDRVYCCGSLTGTYADAVLCRAEQVRALPPELDYFQGAALFVNYHTAFRALFQRGAAGPSCRVLIHGGSGGVGLAALQGAAWKGLQAAATAGTERGRQLSLKAGALYAVDHNDPGHWDQLRSWSGGFDLVIELAADQNLARDADILAPEGRVVVIGSRGAVTLEPRRYMRREADIRGMLLFNTPEAERWELSAMISRAAAEGFVRPVIRKRVPLCRAAEAHRLMEKAGAAGKIVLDTGGGC